MTINDIEKKRALELCEAIVLGFQNEAKNAIVYDELQKVYERIHDEVKPILDKEEIEANENRGVGVLSKYLRVSCAIAKFMLTDLTMVDIIAKATGEEPPKYKACYVGDLHQQILISDLGGNPVEVISVWEGKDENTDN